MHDGSVVQSGCDSRSVMATVDTSRRRICGGYTSTAHMRRIGGGYRRRIRGERPMHPSLHLRLATPNAQSRPHSNTNANFNPNLDLHPHPRSAEAMPHYEITVTTVGGTAMPPLVVSGHPMTTCLDLKTKLLAWEQTYGVLDKSISAQRIWLYDEEDRVMEV